MCSFYSKLSQKTNKKHADQDKSEYKAGDIIAIYREEKKITHYGIYNGRGVLYHVSDINNTGKCGIKEKAKVIDEPLSQVKNGDKSWVSNYKDKDWGTPTDVTDVVERARAALGDYKYHLLTNNCEHFVMWCRYGKKYSSQTYILEKVLPWKVYQKIMDIIRSEKAMDENSKENVELNDIQVYKETVQYMEETELMRNNETEEEKIVHIFEKIMNLQSEMGSKDNCTNHTSRTKTYQDIDQPKFDIRPTPNLKLNTERCSDTEEGYDSQSDIEDENKEDDWVILNTPDHAQKKEIDKLIFKMSQQNIEGYY